MRISGVVACVILAACASTKSSSTSAGTGTMAAATTTQTMSGAGGVGAATAVTMVNDSRAVKTDVSVPLAEAWPRLLAAYEALGIKVTEMDAATRALGNPGLRARRRIGDIQLRQALNCGGESSNPNAESFDLTLSVRSVLTPAGDSTQIETYIRGTGVNTLTNNGNYVQCYSQGVIEKRIAELVQKGVPPRKP